MSKPGSNLVARRASNIVQSLSSFLSTMPIYDPKAPWARYTTRNLPHRSRPRSPPTRSSPHLPQDSSVDLATESAISSSVCGAHDLVVRPLRKLSPGSVSECPLHNFDKFQYGCNGHNGRARLDEARFPLQIDADIRTKISAVTSPVPSPTVLYSTVHTVLYGSSYSTVLSSFSEEP